MNNSAATLSIMQYAPMVRSEVDCSIIVDFQAAEVRIQQIATPRCPVFALAGFQRRIRVTRETERIVDQVTEAEVHFRNRKKEEFP